MAKRWGIDWGLQPLGEVPDAALAERLGVTSMAVTKQRLRRGIRPAKKRIARHKTRPISGWFKLDYDVDKLYCARCNNERAEVRIDWDDIGAVCLDCYLHAPECNHEGCTGIALASGQCRRHDIGDMLTEGEYRLLAEAHGHYHNNKNIEPDPGAGYARRDFGDLLGKKMREVFGHGKKEKGERDAK